MLIASAHFKSLFEEYKTNYHPIVSKVADLALRVLCMVSTLPVFYIGIQELMRAKPSWVVHSAYKQNTFYLLDIYLLGLREIWGPYRTETVELMTVAELAKISANELSSRQMGIAFSRPERIASVSTNEILALLSTPCINKHYLFMNFTQSQLVEMRKCAEQLSPDELKSCFCEMSLKECSEVIVRVESFAEKKQLLGLFPAFKTAYPAAFATMLDFFDEDGVKELLERELADEQPCRSLVTLFDWMDEDLIPTILKKHEIYEQLTGEDCLALLKNFKDSTVDKDIWELLEDRFKRTLMQHPKLALGLLEAISEDQLYNWLKNLDKVRFVQFFACFECENFKALNEDFHALVIVRILYWLKSLKEEQRVSEFIETLRELKSIVLKMGLLGVTYMMEPFLFALLSEEQVQLVDFKKVALTKFTITKTGEGDSFSLEELPLHDWLVYLNQILEENCKTGIADLVRQNFNLLSTFQLACLYAVWNELPEHKKASSDGLFASFPPENLERWRITMERYRLVAEKLQVPMESIIFGLSSLSDPTSDELFQKILLFISTGSEDSPAYELLGLKPNCAPEEITPAYRRFSRRAHPDRESGSLEEFKKGQEAYQFLKTLKGIV